MVADGVQVSIADLLARYNNLVDRGPWEGVADLFTPDGVLDLGAKRLEGRAAIHQFYRDRSFQPITSRHVFSNLMVGEIDVDTVSATSTLTLYREVGGVVPVLLGDFDDRIVRCDGDWRFAERRLHVVFRLGANGQGQQPPLPARGDER